MQLWTDEDVSFAGDYYTTVGATIYDRPEQPVPVYVAAGGPVVANYAGRAGDGFICTSGKGMELYTEKLLPAVAEGAAAADRDPATIDRMIEIKMSYDRDPDRALENCRFWAPLSLTAGAEAQRGLGGGDGAAGRRAADRAGGQALDRGLRPGRRALAQIQPYLDAGLNHLVFHGPGDDQPRFLDPVRRGRAAPAARAGLTGPPRQSGSTPVGSRRRAGGSGASRKRRTPFIPYRSTAALISPNIAPCNAAASSTSRVL